MANRKREVIFLIFGIFFLVEGGALCRAEEGRGALDNEKYYATFLTNKGTNKRYIRYGKLQFRLNGKDYTIETYKSILSDMLFIPFKDMTNGKETYEGGRYIDAEILPG